MGGVSVDGRDGEFIRAVGEMMGRFTAAVFPKLSDWEQRLKSNPEYLDLIEQEVHQEFSRGAGLVVAGLISVAMQLMGGVMMWMTSLCRKEYLADWHWPPQPMYTAPASQIGKRESSV